MFENYLLGAGVADAGNHGCMVHFVGEEDAVGEFTPEGG